MQPISKDNTLLLLQAFTLASLTVLVLFAWQGSKGFDLWDEGYLWYGARQVMQGEVPIRDFMAYDPGRYYWSAGLMSLWGDNGIVALRATSATAAAIGVFIALYCIARTLSQPDPLYLLIAALTLVAWMYPRHALVDASLAIFLIGALAFLAERPSNRSYFLVGVCVGLVAIFGRNHGVYGAFGSIGLMLWLNIKRTDGPSLIQAFGHWAAGVVTGYAPLLLMALLVPGFGDAFWDSVTFIFALKGGTLPVSTPWPWRVDFSAALDDVIRGLVVGSLYVGLVVFGILSILWVFWQRLRDRQVPPALVAVSFLALPYLHRAFTRASVVMLAQSIFPLLIGCLVLLATRHPRVRWTLAITLCLSSWWVMHIFHEGWICRPSQQCATVEVSGDQLTVLPNIAYDIGLLRTVADQYAPHGRSFIATPFWPGAYALLDRKAPMWEIFALFPHPAAFEQAEIARMTSADPGFAFIFDRPLDGIDARRFTKTHPLTFQYIKENFEPVESPYEQYLIYKAKPAAP